MTPVPHDTIIAECTPRGVGALSLLRLSGSDALVIADRMVTLSKGVPLSQLPTHTIHHGWIVDQTRKIDQVLLFLMKAPSTFTGQDTVEITCHGNPFIVQEIIALAITRGARLANPGEFTQKAVLSGKLDIIRAEAIHELITAHTQQALKQSLAQLDGTLSQYITSLQEELLPALALSDASFEFIDEEYEFGPQILAIINRVQEKIGTLIATFGSKKLIKQGVRVALIGAVNTGKSSLFNALLNTKRSIVSDQAGTTRDTVEALIERDGNFITLIDTAGLRITHDSIEQEGIERSHHEAHACDIILLIHDGSRALTTHEQKLYAVLQQQYAHKSINVVTKADLAIVAHTSVSQPLLHVSSLTGLGIATLQETIINKMHSLLQEAASPFLLTERQHTLLVALQQELIPIAQLLQQKSPAYELISYHLRDALAHLNALTGKTISEQGMDLIFRQFCIGK